MNRALFMIAASSCFLLLAWFHFKAAAIDPQPYLPDTLPRTAEALLDTIMSTLFYLWGQAYAHYWYSVAKIRVLPLAMAFLVVPYAAMTWPYGYDFTVYLSSDVSLMAAAVIFTLLVVVRRPVTSKIVALQDAAPAQYSRGLFSRYPPKERMDILGLDAATVVLFLLPVFMA